MVHETCSSIHTFRELKHWQAVIAPKSGSPCFADRRLQGRKPQHLSTALQIESVFGQGGESNAAYGRSEINVPQVHGSKDTLIFSKTYEDLPLPLPGSGLLHAEGRAERLWRLVSSCCAEMEETAEDERLL